MQYSSGVRRRETVAHLGAPCDHIIGERRPLMDDAVEWLPAEQLHDDEEQRTPIYFSRADVVQGHDVLAVEARDNSGLAIEPRHGAGVRAALAGSQRLDRDFPAQSLVVRTPYLAHAACANEIDQPIAAINPCPLHCPLPDISSEVTTNPAFTLPEDLFAATASTAILRPLPETGLHSFHPEGRIGEQVPGQQTRHQ
ncbi:hypothetical protein AS594_33775 [Streptomyces agglomeratus]|uniref:Uncharacterized protein n=1 Tax=Streptomyces agglomeratus TaxID=285458 RepID=A0A1E5PGQ1_9ACTN|nr:hypothetical protein AS594_33775 [Streptomyces agglomeratus]